MRTRNKETHSNFVGAGICMRTNNNCCNLLSRRVLSVFALGILLVFRHMRNISLTTSYPAAGSKSTAAQDPLVQPSAFANNDVLIDNHTFFDSRPMSFTHIPKASGTSFVKEMRSEIKRQNQDCYNHLKRKEMMNAVFLRSPNPHVVSCFMECMHDPWGKRATSKTDFPRTGNDTADFAVWLEHFSSLNDTMVGKTVDYNCIDPRNVMARHLSCQKAPNPKANHALLPPPDLDEAIRNVKVGGGATFVGLTDFYHESMCILEFRRNGSLPAACGCTEEHLAAKAATKRVHVTHGVPKEKPIISKASQALIDRYTDLDRPLFVVALRRFMDDIHVAETVAGRPFLCNKTKATVLLEQYDYT